jgi:bifunctional non-homologous end joining protein LigD
LKNRHKQFVLDGEVVVLGVNGISDFNALHSGKHNHEVQLYAFDVLAMDGVDLGDLPLSIRKTSLARLLHRRPDGIFQISYEQGEIGPQLFPARLSHGAGRTGLQARRSALSRRLVQGLDQGEEPPTSSDGTSDGGVQVKRLDRRAATEEARS